MNWITYKGEAKPHPDNSRIITTAGRKATLLHKCPCTSPILHYEVIFDTLDYITVIQHNEVSEVISLPDKI